MPWKSLRMSDNFARDRSANVFTDKYDEKAAVPRTAAFEFIIHISHYGCWESTF